MTGVRTGYHQLSVHLILHHHILTELHPGWKTCNVDAHGKFFEPAKAIFSLRP